MLDSVTSALLQVPTLPMELLFAMLLGLLSAATSACCAIPALGVLLGYSGAQENVSRKSAFKKAGLFILGTIVSLVIIGGIAGFVGQIANVGLGMYWKIFAGVMLILFGLATLRLLPFNQSFGQLDSVKNRLGKSSEVMLTGFVLGGLVAVNSLCCNPVIFGMVGVAVLQRQILHATLLLGMFAIGFSLPLGAVLLGVSLSKSLFLSKSADATVRWIAGGIQLIVGFYFLITF